MTDHETAKRNSAIAIVDAAIADQSSTIDEAWKARHVALVDSGTISLTQLEMVAKGQLEFVERRTLEHGGYDTVTKKYRTE